jgi:hypothetical protein
VIIVSAACTINALVRVINYTPRVTLQIVASLTDDSRGVFYDCNMFKVQATGNTKEVEEVNKKNGKYWRI